MGAAIIIWIASLVSDNSEEYSKHIKNDEHPY